MASKMHSQYDRRNAVLSGGGIALVRSYECTLRESYAGEVDRVCRAGRLCDFSPAICRLPVERIWTAFARTTKDSPGSRLRCDSRRREEIC